MLLGTDVRKGSSAETSNNSPEHRFSAMRSAHLNDKGVSGCSRAIPSVNGGYRCSAVVWFVEASDTQFTLYTSGK